MTTGFRHMMCPNAEEEFVSEEEFSLQYTIILSKYYKVVVKGLSDKGPDIFKKSSKVYLLLLLRVV